MHSVARCGERWKAIVAHLVLGTVFIFHTEAVAESVSKSDSKSVTKPVAKATVINTQVHADQVIGQWIAAGSGCQASAEKAGDVRLVSALASSENPDVFNVTFALPNYKLKPLEVTQERQKVSLTDYARECAIRLNVNPPAGKMIDLVTAQSEIEVSKDENAKLLVQTALKVGATTVTKQVKQFAKAEVFRFRKVDLELIPGRTPEDEIPEIECEAKKIVGLDMTFLTNKATASALAEARVAKDSLVHMKVSLKPCASQNIKK